MDDKQAARRARLAKWKEKQKAKPKKRLNFDVDSDEEDVKRRRLNFDDPNDPEPEDGGDDELERFMSRLGDNETAESEPVMDDDDDIKQAEDQGENLNEVLANFERKKTKDLAQVDHDKIDYLDFNKQFYVEPEEVREQSQEEVDMIRLELDGIKVHGVDCPKPVLRWGQFGIPANVMEVIDQLGYETPSSIQSQAIPAILSGRDVVGIAKTGSGKTMAFLLPMFRHIKDQPPLKPLDGPIALIMTPTRELAVQIYRECKRFSAALGLKATCVYGGSSLADQIADMKRGAEIVVCTPGRMIDLLVANQGRVTNLRRVTYLVLDEADRMFDMGFEPQVTKIVRNTRPDRQTVMFSATFPKQMVGLAKKILTKPVEIQVGKRSMVAPEVTQVVELVEDKFTRMLDLLGHFFDNEDSNRALIFVDRQDTADDLMIRLVRQGFSAVSTHAGKEQMDRDQAIIDFKRGDVGILVATSVAARGLDVKQLNLVINYDAPSHLEDYVHRVGRTGRAGNTGSAYTFITEKQERQAADVVKAMSASKAAIPHNIQTMADAFMARVKSGKAHYSRTGYKGKGLDRLDEQRKIDKLDKLGKLGETVPAEEEDEGEEIEMDDVVIVQGKFKRDGDDDSDCHAIFVINDLPKQARWDVNNSTMITRMSSEYGVSITGKGQYYPPGKQPKETDEPKLYLLIEGQSADAVRGAYEALKQIAIKAIKVQGAQKPAGRYDV